MPVRKKEQFGESKTIKLMEMVIILYINDMITYRQKESLLNKIERRRKS